MDDKLLKLRKYLKDKGFTQVKIAETFNVDKGYINQLLTGRKAFGKRTAQEWSDHFGLSSSWLLTGEGEMLQVPVGRSDVSLCFETIQGGSGHGTGMEQMTKENAIGVMAVPGVPIGEGTPYIQVRGSSMVNRRDPAHSIPEGAWIGIQSSQSSVIRWGEVYAIMTTDGPIVKKLMPSEHEGYITCVSFNEEDGYLPYELPTVEIIQPLYKVVAVITASRWA